MVGDLAGELIEPDHLLGVAPEAGILAEEEQQVLAQPGEVLDLFQHVFEALAVLFRIAGDAKRDLGLVAEDGQRRAELVGGVGGEPADLLEGALEPPDHPVERPGQPPSSSFGLGACSRRSSWLAVISSAAAAIRSTGASAWHASR